MALPKLHLLPPHGCIHTQFTSVVAAALCSETTDEYPSLCLPTVHVILYQGERDLLGNGTWKQLSVFAELIPVYWVKA